MSLAITGLGLLGSGDTLAGKAVTSTSQSTTSLAARSTDAFSSTKVAADLMAVVNASSTSKLSWAKDVNGVRYVKAIVIGTPSADPDLGSLRASVLAAGGSIYFRYTSDGLDKRNVL